MEAMSSDRYASRISATIGAVLTSSQTSGSVNGTRAADDGFEVTVMMREANSSETPNDRTIRHSPVSFSRHSAYPSDLNTSRARVIAAERTASTFGDPTNDAAAVASPISR
jgi:hypothetical protein